MPNYTIYNRRLSQLKGPIFVIHSSKHFISGLKCSG
jgi:hypothetical protein